MSIADRRVEVDGVTLATLDTGHGPPIVFLHGNPTSSYLWRNIIPSVRDLGRVVAPDLVGHGRSDQASSPDGYRFVEQSHHLDALFEALGVSEEVTLVVHDWGAALGFDWARRNPEAVARICYMEAICGPRSWSDEPDAVGFFRRLRSEEGEQLVLEDNVFIEQILQAGTLRELAPDEMATYRAPFAATGEGRRAMLTWAREIPFDGHPPDVHARVHAAAAWMAQSDVPKLYIHAQPGALSNVFADRCRSWPNQVEVTVPGIHFVQEDAPAAIGRALRGWLLETSGR